MSKHLDHTLSRARSTNAMNLSDNFAGSPGSPGSPQGSPGARSMNGTNRDLERSMSPSKTKTMGNSTRRSSGSTGGMNRTDTLPDTSPTLLGMGTGRGSPPPQNNRCSTPAFKDSISRFEQYASLRNCVSPQTLQLSSAVGPGCYESGSCFRSSSRGGGSVRGGSKPVTASGRSSAPTLPSMVATKLHADSTIFPTPQAPPVGTYTIPQIMQAHTYGEMGIQVSSSFKSSGRTKMLMGDAKYFHTVRDDVRSTNLGPGAYESVKSFMGTATVSPTANDREYRSHRAADKSEDMFRSSISGLKSNINTSPIEYVPLPCMSHGPICGTKLFSPISRKKTAPVASVSISGRPRKQRVRSNTFSLRDKDVIDVQQLPVYD